MNIEFDTTKLLNPPNSDYCKVISFCFKGLAQSYQASNGGTTKALVIGSIQENPPNLGRVLDDPDCLLGFPDCYEIPNISLNRLDPFCQKEKNSLLGGQGGISNAPLNLQARLFAISPLIDPKTDTAKLAPPSGDLYTIGGILNERINSGNQEPDCRINPIGEYWMSCPCQKACHKNVRPQDAPQPHQEYAAKTKNQVFNQLGGVLDNPRKSPEPTMATPPKKTQTFPHSIQGAPVCKGFPICAYGVGRSTVNTLQARIRGGGPYDLKYKSHYETSDDVLDLLGLFIGSGIGAWVLPNPKGDGGRAYLPVNFSWKDVYENFVNYPPGGHYFYGVLGMSFFLGLWGLGLQKK